MAVPCPHNLHHIMNNPYIFRLRAFQKINYPISQRRYFYFPPAPCPLPPCLHSDSIFFLVGSPSIYPFAVKSSLNMLIIKATNRISRVKIFPCLFIYPRILIHRPTLKLNLQNLLVTIVSNGSRH